MSEENKRLVLGMIDQAMNKGQVDVLDDLVDDDYTITPKVRPTLLPARPRSRPPSTSPRSTTRRSPTCASSSEMWQPKETSWPSGRR